MTIPRRLAVVSALVLVAACLAPAGAQPGMQPVTDPRGLFTINIPSDWRVAGSEMSDLVFRGLRTSAVGRNVISTLAAQSLEGDGAPAILAVAAVALPRQVPPAEFGEFVKAEIPPGWTVTQDGHATIAGRDAHYLYFILQTQYPLYMVMAYFNVGQTGFLVVGGTLNEPGPIRKHFATISRVLETFRPSAKLGQFAPPAPGR